MILELNKSLSINSTIVASSTTPNTTMLNRITVTFCFLLIAFQFHANAQLLEGDAGGGAAYVNEYSLTGVPMDTPLAHVTALGLEGIAVSGNDLFTADSYSGTIGEYNLTTGQPIAPSFISLPFAGTYGIAVANNILYATNNGALYAFDISGTPTAIWTVSGLGATGGVTVDGGNVFVINGEGSNNNMGIGEYNSLTGAVISAHLVTGLYDTFGLTSSGNELFTSSYAGGTISEFSTSGQILNASLVSGISDGANGLGISGNNIYVADIFQVQEYNVTTGAYVRTINTNVEQANSIAFVPEPKGIALLAVGLIGLGFFSRISLLKVSLARG